MMAMTISLSPPRSICLDLSWQIKHVRAALGRHPEGRMAFPPNGKFALGQACHAETCQGFVACPIEAGRATSNRTSIRKRRRAPHEKTDLERADCRHLN